MTIEDFRFRYGTAFYAFINSELGQAMLAVLKENDPATRVVTLPPESQTANSTLFLGQTTGWRDCVITIQKQLTVQADGPGEIEPTYERDSEELPESGSITAPQDNTPPPPAPVISKAKAKPKSKRK